MKFRPGRIVFDPRDKSVFWVSGCYGNAPFKTEDGGKTFRRLGKLAHADGVAVDFTDPERKTLLLGLHEQSQSLQLSGDGGTPGRRLATSCPPTATTAPIRSSSTRDLSDQHGGLEAQSDFGHLPQRRRRPDLDAGFHLRAAGPGALLASDGAIYWQRVWGGGLLKSSDQGKDLEGDFPCREGQSAGTARQRLAGLANAQIMISADGGATWTQLGPPAPFKPNGITYSDKGNCFYAWRLSDNMKMAKPSIVRLKAE